ncbi:MAG: hypothetical protein JSU05_09390, partial [Bacteroidetes bacterium]|nr:hypothetical protein [Bacteroidota bacterium]
MKKFFSNILSLKYVLLAIAAVLLLFSYIFNSYFSGDTLVAREKKSLEQYVYKQEKEAQHLLADTSLLRKLLLKRETEKEFDDLAAKKLGLYLMEENEYGFYETTFWSNPIADAPYKNSDEIDGETFEKLANGYYIKIRRSFSLTGINKRIIAYVLIPVFYDYYLETDYLPPRFAYSSKAFERIMISKNNSGIPVNSISGKTLFLINKKTYGAIPYNDAVTILLRISAILLVVFFIYLLAESFAVRNNEWWAVIIFIGLLLLLRIGLYFFPHILNLRQFELFDPSIYGSNFVNKSLGDLLINAVFFSWIALFAWNKLPDPKRGLKVLNGIWKWVASIGLLYFLIISTFILANLIRGLIADSKISFD